MKVISFHQLIRSCDLAHTCQGELHKIPATIGILEKSIVEREPWQFFEIMYIWYEWCFLPKFGEKRNHALRWNPHEHHGTNRQNFVFSPKFGDSSTLYDHTGAGTIVIYQ